MNHIDTPDRDVEHLLRDSTDALAPDVERLVAGGVTRGRAVRRRRRAGTTLAAVAVVGVIGVGAGVAPHLGGDTTPASSPGFADGGTKPLPAPPARKHHKPAKVAAPDAPISVSARQIPGVIGDLLGVQPTPPLTQHPYPLDNARFEKTVHFRVDGMLVTFVIERADRSATCQEQISRPIGGGGSGSGEVCERESGHDVLRWGPTTGDGVTAQGISYWTHGYVVTALAYNAADGKEVPSLQSEPVLTMQQLEDVATSEAWFTN